MDKHLIIKKSIESLEKLPEEVVFEILRLVDSVSDHVNEEKEFKTVLDQILKSSDSFSFLKDEEDLYEEKDMIVKYSNGKR